MLLGLNAGQAMQLLQKTGAAPRKSLFSAIHDPSALQASSRVGGVVRRSTRMAVMATVRSRLAMLLRWLGLLL